MHLEPVDAVGNCLQLSRKGTFPANIKTFSCHLEDEVAESKTDGIIGLDFIEKYQCTID